MTNKNDWNEWKGLSEAEAAERRARFGANALPVPRHRLLKLIARQFRGIFNLMLLIAAGVTFSLGEPIDGAFILLFVFLGTALNVYQEHKSNQAADKLKAYLLSTITVMRDGVETEVPTELLVPGDLLHLESGDIVPADAVVRVARDLLVDETTFTGESIPVEKRGSVSTTISSATDKVAADEERLLQGIVIVRGNVLAEVTAIGQETQLAQIASTASAVQVESELVKSVDKISNFIMKVTLLTLGLVVLANLLIEGRQADVTGLLVFCDCPGRIGHPGSFAVGVDVLAFTGSVGIRQTRCHRQAAFRGPGFGISQSVVHRQDRHNHGKPSCLQQCLSDGGIALRSAGLGAVGCHQSA